MQRIIGIFILLFSLSSIAIDGGRSNRRSAEHSQRLPKNIQLAQAFYETALEHIFEAQIKMRASSDQYSIIAAHIKPALNNALEAHKQHHPKASALVNALTKYQEEPENLMTIDCSIVRYQTPKEITTAKFNYSKALFALGNTIDLDRMFIYPHSHFPVILSTTALTDKEKIQELLTDCLQDIAKIIVRYPKAHTTGVLAYLLLFQIAQESCKEYKDIFTYQSLSHDMRQFLDNHPTLSQAITE